MNLFKEIKDRSIIQVSIAYIAIAWLLAQVAAVVLPTFEAPEWLLKALIFFLVIGFPVAIVLAWAQSLKKEAKKEELEKTSAEESDSASINPKSIAVLPFDDMSPDKDQEYFSDGMAEEILNLLARIPDLTVIGRTSSFFFKEQKAGIQEIGEKLKVAHVLEGSVRKSGNKLRITAQLIKASDESHIWSESYDRELVDVFQIQDDIALAITQKLKATLLADANQLKRQIPENFEAYELVLKGRHFLNRGIDELSQSLTLIQRALEIEPDYGPAHAAMGSYYNVKAAYGFMEPTEALPKIIAAHKRAIAIDPTMMKAFAELATSRMGYEWNWPLVKADLDNAVALNPDDSLVNIALANWYYICDKEAECIACSNAAVAIDPLNVLSLNVQGFHNYWYGHYDTSEQSYRSALDLAPNHSESIRYLAEIHMQRGEYEKALALAQKAFDSQSGLAYSPETLARVHIYLGNIDEAQKLLQQVLDRAKTEFVLPIVPAVIYGALGDLDNGFEWLNKAYVQRDQAMRFLKREPVYDSFRSDPRFDELVERMNFPTG